MAIASKLPPVRRTDKPEGKRYVTCLIYGIARVGKTYALRTLPPEEIFLLATEPGDFSGTGSLKDVPIDWVHVEDWDTAEAVIRELGRERAKSITQYQGKQYQHVVLDSITAAGPMWLKKGLSFFGRDEVGIPQKGEGFDPRKLYGYVAEKGRQTYDRLAALRANVIILAREGTMALSKDDTIYEQTPVPDVPGSTLERELPGWPDITLRAVMINDKRLWQTVIVNNSPAGIRDSVIQFPKYIRQDLGALFDAFRGDESALARLKP